MWAIAARTQGSVKRIDDDDKSHRKEKRKSISTDQAHRGGDIYAHVVPTLFPHPVVSPLSLKIHDPSQPLVIHLRYHHDPTSPYLAS